MSNAGNDGLMFNVMFPMKERTAMIYEFFEFYFPDLTIQIKSLDINIFFLPYFLNPNPAGIRAGNLELKDCGKNERIDVSTNLLQNGLADGFRTTLTFFFVF